MAHQFNAYSRAGTAQLKLTNTSRSNSALGATAVMAGIIAGSVAGWSPIEINYGDNDSLRFSSAGGRTDVSSRDGTEVPQTKPGDMPQILLKKML